jgi:hypothetical protein
MSNCNCVLPSKYPQDLCPEHLAAYVEYAHEVGAADALSMQSWRERIASRLAPKACSLARTASSCTPSLLLALWQLYGAPLDPRLWFAFFVHDTGDRRLRSRNGGEVSQASSRIDLCGGRNEKCGDKNSLRLDSSKV